MVMEELSFVGDVEEDEIVFSDFIVKIDFGDKKFNEFDLTYSSFSSPNRRCRLFDKEGNLIEEVIEDNPYQFDIPDEVLRKIFSDNSDIIY